MPKSFSRSIVIGDEKKEVRLGKKGYLIKGETNKRGISSNLTQTLSQRAKEFNPPKTDFDEDITNAMNVMRLSLPTKNVNESDWKTVQLEDMAPYSEELMRIIEDPDLNTLNDYFGKEYSPTFPDDLNRSKLYFYTNTSYPNSYENPNATFI